MRRVREPSRSGTREASSTARLMAVQRALESSRPARSRLFVDPLARSFVGPGWRIILAVAHIGVIRNAIESLYDFVGGPGPRASAIARTRLIDDSIEQLAPSLTQIVVLGAGFDSRPYRLGCLSRCAVFEVDHPDTQAMKRSLLNHAGEVRPGHVRFVPVDFEIDDLATALLQSGYDTDTPCLFLWEGVTQYLTAEAIDGTLAAIRGLSHAGSYLVFTYVDDAVIGGDSDTFPEAEKWLRGVRRRGEPWIFGIAPADTARFLRDRGFLLREDISTAEAGHRYFDPLGRRERGSGLYRVAVALVPRC
jgi:methyltransferase (TIGR00027 family)